MPLLDWQDLVAKVNLAHTIPGPQAQLSVYFNHPINDTYLYNVTKGPDPQSTLNATVGKIKYSLAAFSKITNNDNGQTNVTNDIGTRNSLIMGNYQQNYNKYLIQNNVV